MKFNYITIEREYASGGSEIGKRAAQLLNIPCYGREVLEITAKRRGVSVDYVEELEENSSGSFLYSLYKMSNVTSLTPSEKVNAEEIGVIKELSGNGPAVFVGRSASFALEEKKNVLRVFVHASDEFREKRACEVYGIDSASVRTIIKKYDKRRAAYYKSNLGKEWKDYEKYDLVLDSSVIGIERCAALIAECAK